MRTRIISAFPGTGKSHFTAANPGRAVDSDSSSFSWRQTRIHGASEDIQRIMPAKERNPDFPGNYIAHIKEQIGKYEFIFVSSHHETRQALRDNCLFHYVVYPTVDQKDEYLRRYKDRGSDQGFLDLLAKNWSAWIADVATARPGCERLEMPGGYIEETLVRLVFANG